MNREVLVALIKSLVAAGKQYAEPILEELKGRIPEPAYIVASWALEHADCVTELVERLMAETFSAGDPTTDPLAEITGKIAECREACPAA